MSLCGLCYFYVRDTINKEFFRTVSQQRFLHVHIFVSSKQRKALLDIKWSVSSLKCFAACLEGIWNTIPMMNNCIFCGYFILLFGFTYSIVCAIMAHEFSAFSTSISFLVLLKRLVRCVIA